MSDQDALDRSGDSPVLPRLATANADFVTPRLAVGGDLSPVFTLARRQLDELVEAGITHIADLRDEWSDEDLVAAWHPEVRYRHHRVMDAGQVIPARWFEELRAWVDDALADPDAKVLVHCHMGVNRAPSAVFGLLLAQGWPVRRALSAIRQVRPVAVIDYAQDALAWHLERTDADARQRGAARRALTMWRRANDIDREQVIRRIRSQEHDGNSWLLLLDREITDEVAEVLAGRAQVIRLPVDDEPEALAQRDEALLWCADTERSGLVGVGLVMGPVAPTDAGVRHLPVLIRAFTPDPMPVPAAEADLRTLSDARTGAAEVRFFPAPSVLLRALDQL